MMLAPLRALVDFMQVLRTRRVLAPMSASRSAGAESKIDVRPKKDVGLSKIMPADSTAAASSPSWRLRHVPWQL
jgi:hypothetical protein